MGVTKAREGMGIAVADMTAAKLQVLASIAWDSRWRLAWDMNGDGRTTIFDAWLWLKWLFFAPGDFVLLTTMSRATPFALFLEWEPSMLGGWSSLIISLLAWLVLYAGFAEGQRAPRERPGDVI
jgi:hypothetical protein